MGEENGKRGKAGKSLPAWILGFCEIFGISVNEENEELLLLLQVPEVFEYVMTELIEVVTQKSFARRNNGIRKNTHHSEPGGNGKY